MASPKATLPDWEHLSGCPMTPERIEVTEVKRPDGTLAVVVHCCDCGGQVVEDKITNRKEGSDARA